VCRKAIDYVLKTIGHAPKTIGRISKIDDCMLKAISYVPKISDCELTVRGYELKTIGYGLKNKAAS